MSEREGHERRVNLSKIIMNPSVEHLIGEFIACRQEVESYKNRIGDDKDKLDIIALCENQIKEIESALHPSTWWKRRKIFTIWHLLHRVGENTILLMGKEELIAVGRKIIGDFKTSSITDVLKTDWITKLEERQKRLEGNSVSHQDIDNAAQFFKTAMNVVNNYTDDRFWDIWSKKLLALIYTVLLIACMTMFFFKGFSDLMNPLPGVTLGILLLGAIGGLASGIITGEREYLAKGHFWISTLYYSLVRPVLGALAAIMMSWMLQSQYLIKIEPPIDKNVNVQSQQKSGQSQKEEAVIKSEGKKDVKETTQKKAEGKDSGVSDGKKDESASKDTSIVIRTSQGKQIYIYALLLLLAGFSGDKLLKAVADKVSSRLFAEAEKTRVGKS